MKAPAQQAFWPLRPISTARALELASWLAAAILALALTLGPATNTGEAAQATTVTAPTPASHLKLYQQHCVERILMHATGKTEEEVANQIKLQCRAEAVTKASTATGLTPLSCDRRFTAPFAPVPTRVLSCVGR